MSNKISVVRRRGSGRVTLRSSRVGREEVFGLHDRPALARRSLSNEVKSTIESSTLYYFRNGRFGRTRMSTETSLGKRTGRNERDLGAMGVRSND